MIIRIKYFLYVFSCLCFFSGNAQTVLFSDDFESYGANVVLTGATAGWRSGTFLTSTNQWEINNAAACKIAGNRSLMITNAGTTCTYKKTDNCQKVAYNATPINSTGYSCLDFIFDYKVNGELIGSTVYDYLQPAYSLNGTTWTALTQFYYLQTTTATATISLPAACSNQATLYVGFIWVNDGSGGTDVPSIIDNVIVKGTFGGGPAANDACASATAMTFTGSTASIAGNNGCASADNVTPTCYSNLSNVWHTFVPPTTGNYYISVLGGTLTNPTFAAYRYTTPCSAASATQIACGVYSSAGYVSASACGLIAGQTYYVSVDSYGSNGTYTLSVTGSIANDLITTPANINSCGTNFSSSTIFATNCGDGGTYGQNVDNNVATGGFGGGTDVGFSVENSSWYNFCNGGAASASYTVTMTNSGSCTGPYGVQLAAFTGSPTALTLVSGGTSGMDILPAASFTTSGITLAVGACAYIMVDGYAGTNCNYYLSVAASPICALLPVKLLYFDGYANNTENILKWATAEEINTDKFIIERSKDSYNYEILASLRGAGNSSVKINYEETDANPFPGGTYYRLKQLNLDNTFTYTNPVFISSDKNYDKFEIITLKPNPTGNNTTVKYSIPYKGNLSIELYDSFSNKIGQKEIKTDSGVFEDNLDLEGLREGIYFIRATFDYDHTVTKYIVKSNTTR